MKKYIYTEYPAQDKKIAEISFPFNDISDDNINDSIIRFLEEENYTVTELPRSESWKGVVSKVVKTDEGTLIFKKVEASLLVYTTKKVSELIKLTEK